MCEQSAEEYNATHWCPDVCPITGRPFFMWIEHHETKKMVPTYGGPFDSYTIPERDASGSYLCERYDHDAGWWVDEYEDVGIQIVNDQLYTHENELSDIQADAVRSLKFPTMLRKMWAGSEVAQWLSREADRLASGDQG